MMTDRSYGHILRTVTLHQASAEPRRVAVATLANNLATRSPRPSSIETRRAAAREVASGPAAAAAAAPAPAGHLMKCTAPEQPIPDAPDY